MKHLVLVLSLVACGDNNIAPDARVPPMHNGDAGTTSPRAVIVAPSAMFGVPPGMLSVLDLGTMQVRQNLAAGLVGSDPVLRKIDDKLYIVNRGENNVTVLDAATLNYLDQIGTGASSNPQDVAVANGKLYIPAYGTAGVVVATNGTSATTVIDLHTALGDADGKPDCESVYAVGNDVYVACGLLTNFAATVNGKVAVIDATTDTVRTTFDLPDKNPYGAFIVQSPATSVFGGDLLISMDPSFSDLTVGCLVRVAPGATPTATCAVPNAMIGGQQTHVDVFGTGPVPMLWLAVEPTFTQNQLRAYDMQTGSSWTGSVSPGTEQIRDLAACPDGHVVLADAAGNGGFRVYDSSGAEVTTDELPIGLPPGFGNGLVCY